MIYWFTKLLIPVPLIVGLGLGACTMMTKQEHKAAHTSMMQSEQQKAMMRKMMREMMREMMMGMRRPSKKQK